MSKAFQILSVILISATLSFAEGPPSGKPGHDDHDNGPVQSGYAVVTPSGGAAGLVVFETFGQKSTADGSMTQAGVLPPDLTTSAILFVESSGRLSKNLGVAIVNPNSSDASVTLTLRKADGTQAATTTITVHKNQQVSKFVTELFPSGTTIPSDFTGTLSITSTSNIAVIGLRFRGSNFSTLPATSLSPSGAALPTIATGVGGAGAILLPEFAAGGGWATEVSMVNTTGSALTVRLDLFKADGTALSATLNGTTGSSFTSLSVPAHGVLVLAPRNTNGDDDF